jgi:hypothetical protein
MFFRNPHDKIHLQGRIRSAIDLRVSHRLTAHRERTKRVLSEAHGRDARATRGMTVAVRGYTSPRREQGFGEAKWMGVEISRWRVGLVFGSAYRIGIAMGEKGAVGRARSAGRETRSTGRGGARRVGEPECDGSGGTG